jgi:hypothetical protein
VTSAAHAHNRDVNSHGCKNAVGIHLKLSLKLSELNEN